MKHVRGSEWRKWDLHVHTPASALNNRYGGDWDKYVKALFCQAVSKNIACIGITDDFSIEGYKKSNLNISNRPANWKNYSLMRLRLMKNSLQK